MVKKIKIFLTDVDGVLTDAGMYYTESGDEFKKFNTHDGMAFRLLREQGIKTGMITSEDTVIVKNRARKLQVDYLYQGARDMGKLDAAKEICEKEKVSLYEIAYIGDDLNCIPLLKEVGLAACPANAVAAVRELPGIVKLKTRGGDGAFRELVDWYLNETK